MKFLFPTPVVFDGDVSRFLQRDGARFARYLASEGHEARKIILSENLRGGRGAEAPRGCETFDSGSAGRGPVFEPRGRANPTRAELSVRAPMFIPSAPDQLLEVSTPADWRNPDYWRAQEADGVLLYGGINPLLEPVALAVREAGIPLVLKLDMSAGIVRFPKDVSRQFVTGYFRARESNGPVRAFLLSVWRQISRLRPSRIRFLERYLPLFDTVTCENEFALRNTREWASVHLPDPTAPRIDLLEHPVPDEFMFSSGAKKSPQVLAAALDWSNPRKGGCLLASVLARALPARPAYSAVVVGDGSQAVKARAEKEAGRDLPIRAVPRQSGDGMAGLYRSSEIFLLPSGSEGNPNVAFEALCSGCSLVFPATLAGLRPVVESRAGIAASARNVQKMTEALEAEISGWESGRRSPERISSEYSKAFHVSELSERLLTMFETSRKHAVRS